MERAPRHFNLGMKSVEFATQSSNIAVDDPLGGNNSAFGELESDQGQGQEGRDVC